MGKLAFAIVLLAGTLASPAFAQSLEDRLRDQLRSEMNQVQQLQDQQAGLQAEKAAAERERDDLKAQLAAAKAQLAHASRSAADVREEAALEAQVSQYKNASTQAAATAQQAQADHDKLQAAVADAQKKLGLCQDKNAALLKVGNEILDAYQNFDIGDAVGANEPFIGTKRVELENMAQDFDDQLHAGKFDPNAKTPAPSAPQAAAAAGNGH